MKYVGFCDILFECSPPLQEFTEAELVPGESVCERAGKYSVHAKYEERRQRVLGELLVEERSVKSSRAVVEVLNGPAYQIAAGLQWDSVLHIRFRFPS